MNLLDNGGVFLSFVIQSGLRCLLFIRRRNLLLSLISSVFASRVLGNGTTAAEASQVTSNLAGHLESSFSVDGDRALQKRAADKGILFGAYPEGGYPSLAKDEGFRTALTHECSLVVGGFLWWWHHATADTFDYSELDAIHQFALDRGIQFQGGALIWHQLLPQWLKDKLEDENTLPLEIKNRMVDYISTAIKRYQGSAHSWIVLNEAIAPEEGREDALRMTPWLKRLGADYVEIAFRTAAAANPELLLVYNEYGLEYDTPDAEEKRAAVLKFLKHLKSQEVPIHALGIQSHLVGDRHDDQFKGLQSFLREVAGLGLKIFISEMDVSDKALPANIEERDHLVATVYENYLAAVLAEPAVISIISWGLSDRYTWLSTQEPRPDGFSVRPLPLDNDMNRKLAWNAIARALDACPPRP
jgi:endo-1,4-beta-xylanase